MGPGTARQGRSRGGGRAPTHNFSLRTQPQRSPNRNSDANFSSLLYPHRVRPEDCAARCYAGEGRGFARVEADGVERAAHHEPKMVRRSACRPLAGATVKPAAWLTAGSRYFPCCGSRRHCSPRLYAWSANPAN